MMDDQMRAVAAMTARLVQPQPITLENLVGDHVLTGVEFGRAEPREGFDGVVNTCMFVLDFITYTVTEDPDDGYRSHMQSIIQGQGRVTNVFEPCDVVCTLRLESESSPSFQRDNVLEMRDRQTRKLVLEIGTANTDDYYPYYVARFDPTAMSINSTKGIRR